MTSNHEIKSQLAKLLASENIQIMHEPNAKTAAFDVKNRVLVLPVWQNISEDLYDMLVVHETGHALDTPADEWVNQIDVIAKKHHNNPSARAKMAVKDFLNIVEDARIDKRQKRRYPGSKRNYVAGYKELLDRNFFGIDGKEISSLPFIDRINLYFKTSGIIIPFSPEERGFVKKISETESFEEVIALTDELYGYAVAKSKKDSEQQKQDDSESYESDDDSYEFGSQEYDETDDESELDDSETSDNNTDDSDGDQPDGEAQNTSSKDSHEKKFDNDDHVPESITEASVREKMKSIVVDTNTNYYYINLPTVNYQNVVDDYKIVVPEMMASMSFMTGEYKTRLRTQLTEWKNKEKDTISFMVKEFEMRKSADQYSRISVAKTGVLDVNKLHSYKYDEDIFRKLAILPDGKNHGFVMVLDWSGSMVSNLENTMKQLFSLTMFCKRVQIPFDVYLFRTKQYGEDPNGSKPSFTYKKNDIMFHNFKLRNVLSSRMNLSTFNSAMECLWVAAKSNRLSSDVMDSTPLNQAILALDQIVLDFKKKNKLQVVNTIILTDGSSDPADYRIHQLDVKPYSIKGSVYTTKDAKTGLTLTSTSIPAYDPAFTQYLLKVLKARTNTNLIGFYLYNGNFKSLYTTRLVDYVYVSNEKNRTHWSENGYVSLTNSGYDEYYIIKTSNSFNTDDKLEVDSTMTKGKVLKNFIKFNTKKSVNRTLLSKFITKISKAA